MRMQFKRSVGNNLIPNIKDTLINMKLIKERLKYTQIRTDNRNQYKDTSFPHDLLMND